MLGTREEAGRYLATITIYTHETKVRKRNWNFGCFGLNPQKLKRNEVPFPSCSIPFQLFSIFIVYFFLSPWIFT